MSALAYKPMDEIISNIRDTVEIIEVIKPVYNFKRQRKYSLQLLYFDDLLVSSDWYSC